ncbi:MAG: LLM class flavin-dependent oxidoreductase [Micromonosporaceae bacterium]|nr:LLM class flavin-dependent oxidoreductase [Micromonosporaceae bacterium]
MRVGVVILPDQRWADAARRWRLAEEYGFAHAWTYDHIGWRSLVDGPWFDAAVTLAAAAGVTSRIRLGTMVASPHVRHPVSFARVVTALDDLTGGRLTVGVGAGTTNGFDVMVLGQPPLSPREHTDRFAEFVHLLDALLCTDRVTYRGRYYTAVDARNRPGCVQRPRVPFVVAANGPRGRALAAQYGQGWVTTGPATDDVGAWWRGVAEANERFTEAVVAAGRDPSTVDRYLNVDACGVYSLSSVAAFVDAAGRAAEAGFTDLLVHWPRADDWYAGDEAVLEAVAIEVLPGLSGSGR